MNLRMGRAWQLATMSTALMAATIPHARAVEVSFESPAVVIQGVPDEPTTDFEALRVDDCDGINSSCWDVASILKLSIHLSFQGESKTCVKRCRIPGSQLHVVRTDATYEMSPGTGLACPDSPAVILLDTGTVVPGRRRKLSLIPDNIAEIEAVLPGCIGARGSTFKSFLKPSKDGSRIRGRTGLRGRDRLGEGRVRFAMKVKKKGVATGSGDAPSTGRRLDPCPPVLTLRCVLRVGP